MNHRASILSVAVAAAAGLAVVSCRDDDRTRSRGSAVAVERVRGTTVVRSAGTGEWGGDTVTAAASVRFAAGGRVTALAADDAGRVYVGDADAGTVRVFGPRGEALGTVGAPGELRGLRSLAVGPGGALWVVGESRVARFVPAAPGGLPVRRAAAFAAPAYPTSAHPARVDARGRLYAPCHHAKDGRASWYYLVYDSTGARVDSVAPPPFARAPGAYAFPRGRGERRVDGVTHVPFAPLPAWDVTPTGTLVAGDARRFVLLELSPRGDTLRRIEWVKAPRAVPARELRDSAAALKRRLDSLPVPARRMVGIPNEVRARRLPTRYPSYVRIHAADDGRLWVQEWPLGRRDRLLFEVFDPSGALLGTVVVPVALERDPAPVFTAGAVYGVVADPATGARQVVRLSLPLPG